MYIHTYVHMYIHTFVCMYVWGGGVITYICTPQNASLCLEVTPAKRRTLPWTCPASADGDAAAPLPKEAVELVNSCTYNKHMYLHTYVCTYVWFGAQLNGLNNKDRNYETVYIHMYVHTYVRALRNEQNRSAAEEGSEAGAATL